MRIRILGTGTPIPFPNRQGTAIAVTVENEMFLIDCGPGTIYALTENGIDLTAIEKVFFTHHHPDHNGDFHSFATIGWILGRDRLSIFGPEGIENYQNALTLTYDGYFEYLKERDNTTVLRGLTDIQTTTLEDGYSYTEPNWGIFALGVEHSIETYALKVHDYNTGAKFVYSGDTRPIQRMSSFAKGADVLVHEATLGEPRKELSEDRLLWRSYAYPEHEVMERMKTIHSSPKDAAKLAASAGVDTLVLTHFNDYHDTGQMKKVAESIFDGDVIIAEDGIAVDVPPS